MRRAWQTGRGMTCGPTLSQSRPDHWLPGWKDWVSGPVPSDLLDHAAEEGMRENMRQTLAHWRAMTPEQRADFGLSEEGWEDELFGHLGLDLKGL